MYLGIEDLEKQPNKGLEGARLGNGIMSRIT